jgi:hypothetical protein
VPDEADEPSPELVDLKRSASVLPHALLGYTCFMHKDIRTSMTNSRPYHSVPPSPTADLLTLHLALDLSSSNLGDAGGLTLADAAVRLLVSRRICSPSAVITYGSSIFSCCRYQWFCLAVIFLLSLLQSLQCKMQTLYFRNAICCIFVVSGPRGCNESIRSCLVIYSQPSSSHARRPPSPS